MFTRQHLDHLVLDVELVLISVVQGVALTTLAIEAAPMLRAHHVGPWIAVATGVLFILSFWSVALIHAISFVAWPMDLIHYFFYFGLALLECLTFTCVDRPRDWFGYSIACFVLAWGLYAYDAHLIAKRKPHYDVSPAYRALYTHIVRRQRLEMLGFMPAGLLAHIAAWHVVARHPEAATTLLAIQFVLMLAFVVSFVRSFTRRQALIGACV